jgi:hypothetical protein
LRNFEKHGPKSQGFLEIFNRVVIYLFRAIEYPSSLQFSAYDDLEAEKWDITKEKREKKKCATLNPKPYIFSWETSATLLIQMTHQSKYKQHLSSNKRNPSTTCHVCA